MPEPPEEVTTRVSVSDNGATAPILHSPMTAVLTRIKARKPMISSHESSIGDRDSRVDGPKVAHNRTACVHHADRMRATSGRRGPQPF